MANVNGGLVANNQNKNQNLQTMVHPKNILANENMKKRFTEILGKKAPGFMSSILALYNSDNKFAKVDGYSVVNAALLAATLDLPINKEFGFAWVIPYGKEAQFQIGYKGYIQLALRTGQYKNLNVVEIYEGQLVNFNPLTEDLELNVEAKTSDKVIGYAFFMRLINGFEKTIYWPIEKVREHGKRFSKTFNNGPWKTDFDVMAKKTVLKNGLSKWGILSVEMQKAIEADQAVVDKDISNVEDLTHQDLKYVDNPETENVVDAEYKNESANREVETGQENMFADTPFN